MWREKEPSRLYIGFYTGLTGENTKNFTPKQKIKKLRADKRLVLCYTIKTDILSILLSQGGAFL
jgi:hypothetical protein